MGRLKKTWIKVTESERSLLGIQNNMAFDRPKRREKIYADDTTRFCF